MLLFNVTFKFYLHSGIFHFGLDFALKVAYNKLKFTVEVTKYKISGLVKKKLEN